MKKKSAGEARFSWPIAFALIALVVASVVVVVFLRLESWPSRTPDQIVIQLPHAQILDVTQEQVEVLAYENGFWNRISGDDVQSELSILPELAREKAAETGLSVEAERALQKQLDDRIHTPQPLRLIFTSTAKID